MFQNDIDKMSAVLARTWNYLSGLGQEPGWAVCQIDCKSRTGVNKKQFGKMPNYPKLFYWESLFRNLKQRGRHKLIYDQ